MVFRNLKNNDRKIESGKEKEGIVDEFKEVRGKLRWMCLNSVALNESPSLYNVVIIEALQHYSRRVF